MTEEVISRGFIGRLSAAMFFLSGLLTIASPLLPAPPGANLLGVVIVGLVALVTGVLVWFLPWHRWPRRATLVLMPPGLALIAVHNYFTGEDPYRYVLYFTVAFMAVGIAHPPGTSTLLAPLLTVAYLAPMLVTPHPAWASSSVIYAVLVCVLVGETIAWVSKQWGRAQAALVRSEARFRSLVQNASDGITVVGEDGVILYDSPAIQRILGYEPGTRIGKKGRDYIHPDDWPTLQNALAESLTYPGTARSLEVRARCADGMWRWMEVSMTNLLHDPSVGGIVSNYRDSTERRLLEEQLRHQAFHDPLTSLANRALFRNRVEHSLARQDRRKGSVAVLFLDLDGFKTINDSLGHSVGDQLLVAVADRLQRSLRTADTIARLGGDEFAVLFEDMAQSDAARVAERIIESLKAPFTLQNKEVSVRGSIGIALGSPDRDGPDELLRNADVAMYRAKARGKGYYEVFEESMHVAVLERLELEAALRQAVDREEFTLHYQPLVALQTGRVVGVEALVRWAHPVRGVLSPATFIPIAEETGLILAMDRWVLRRACAQVSLWQEQSPLTVSVNLSVRHLQQPDLVEEVSAILRESGLPADSLVLEITESVLLHETDTVIGKLRALRSLGVKLAIDDFGTGYSSLSYLRRFPIDIVKIDKSFVTGVGGSTQESALARAIIELGRILHLEMVAEGVERFEQLTHLQALGCDLGQGYYFARPLDAEGIETLLRNGGLPSSH